MSAPRISYLILRRMRRPLLVLLATYSIALLGLTLIPGVDDNGDPWRMGFFHAYYFLSYTATTIGFGEIPYPFTDAQRAWVLISIYLTVIAWFYAIGAILSLVQDPALRRALVQAGFRQSVRGIREPFVIVCGFGDTGQALVRALTRRFRRVVVIDRDPEAINELQLMDYPVYVPGLAADASVPATLEAAGLGRFRCAAVVAVIPSDKDNLKVAISSKLLNSRVPVYARAETVDIEDNMASFGTDHIIDPFRRFADLLALAIEAPGVYLLHHWLSAVPHSALDKPVFPPSGLWVLCGYGRFGKAVHRQLRALGMEVIVIESAIVATRAPAGSVAGRGTEARTLSDAGIQRAVAVVAGTDDDTNNLSIVMTARALRPELFVVIRQNRAQNRHLFERIKPDLLMQHSRIIARSVRVMLTEPLLGEFLRLSHDRDNDWGNQVTSRLLAVVDEEVPEVWSVTVTYEAAAGVMAALDEGLPVGLRHLTLDPRDCSQCLRCIPLMLARTDHTVLLPASNLPLEPGDRVLFCGDYGIARRMDWLLQDPHGFRYVVTGESQPRTPIGRWLRRRQRRLESTDNEEDEFEVRDS